MKKASFWDFDGTIIRPNQSFLNAFQAALRQHGWELPEEEIREHLRGACTWYSPETAYPEETGSRWWECLFVRHRRFLARRGVSRAAAESINESFRRRILDAGQYSLFEDARAALARCRELGYENYLLSNNYPELPQVAEELGLGPYFRDFFISSKIGYEKPREEIFRFALETAGYPEVSYMIGDNPVADIQGGKRAGLKTILVHAGGSTEADLSCESLREIPELLP